jgi:hypothetical protein
MEGWSFLTSHARVLLCIAHDPGVRLRDIAASLGITERSAYGIVTDLTTAGYIVKHKDGRRNRYQIQAHMPLPEPASQQPTIGKVLTLLAGAAVDRRRPAARHHGVTHGRHHGVTHGRHHGVTHGRHHGVTHGRHHGVTHG